MRLRPHLPQPRCRVRDGAVSRAQGICKRNADQGATLRRDGTGGHLREASEPTLCIVRLMISFEQSIFPGSPATDAAARSAIQFHVGAAPHSPARSGERDQSVFIRCARRKATWWKNPTVQRVAFFAGTAHKRESINCLGEKLLRASGKKLPRKFILSRFIYSSHAKQQSINFLRKFWFRKSLYFRFCV